MKTNVSAHARRRGFSYMIVVCTVIVVGTILASYLKLVASQNQMTMRSQAWNRSVAVLEAGIEEALAHLNRNATFDPSNGGSFFWNLWSDGWSLSSDGWRKVNYVNEDYYIVNIGFFTWPDTAPIITSEGYVKQVPTLSGIRRAGPMLAAVSTPATYVKRSVLCETTNRPMFTKALIAKYAIDLKGNNVRTDSYNSQIAAYNTAGRYDKTKALDHGDIATNQGVTNTGASTLDLGNANVFGSIATGPNLANPGTAAAVIGPNGGVGDFAWMANAANKGKIQPEHSKDDMNIEFPDVIPPFTSGLSSDGTVNWTNGVTYPTSFSAGNDYVVDGLSGRVLIRGSGVARVRVNGDINLIGGGGDNADQILIAPGASLILFMHGINAALAGNGVINPGYTTNFYFLSTPRNTAITFSGNGEFTGVIYAPGANMTFNGGGHDVMDFSGSATVQTATFNGHYNFHYDEALPKISMYRGWVLTSWNEH